MRTIRNILESMDITQPTKVKETSNYKELWFDLDVKIGRTQQQVLINGYINSVKHNS